jgi:3-hydroxybutyryl-CoA dehydrogenase
VTDALSKDIVVAVIGAGTMGRGIAQVAATAGHKVLLFDMVDGFAAEAATTIRDDLAQIAARGKGKGDPDEIAARIRPVTILEALAPAGLAIEVVVERLDTKVDLLTRLESICVDEAILATNTSSF